MNHTGSHKINNTLGQALLARRMGKKKVIAETGAGQHGVATATAAALFGMECRIFMGEEDIRRQAHNVSPDEDPRRRGRPRRRRDGDPQGCDERGDARLGHIGPGYLLRHRHHGRPPPLPGDGPRLPERHRPGGEEADPQEGRAAPRSPHRLHRRGEQRPGALPPLPRRSRRGDDRRGGGRERGSTRGSMRRASRRGGSASSTGTRPISSRTNTARSGTPMRSPPASTIRA